MRRGLRTLIITSTVATVAAGALVTPSAGAEPAESSTTARIGVSVATLWTSPDAPRTIDAAALGTAANPAAWLRSLSTGERRGLNGRVESQALYGQPVEVLEQRDGWARVVLPTQPSPKDDRGYPGWIPLEQLVTAGALPAKTSPPTGLEAVVKRRKAWAFDTADRTVGALKLSYGTRLPVLGVTGPTISVSGPDGRALWVSAKRVKVVATGDPARRPTKRAVVKEARKFLGLPYLWGGTSGFGFDCSGFTHAVYAQLGIEIPRDATPQFGEGTPIVSRADLRRGDLVFFRTSGGVLHHVGIYVGRGRMIHSPRTGQPVQYSTITTGLWAREFAGGRRLL
jgi:cell wall-associated NlpC family hydrolase